MGSPLSSSGLRRFAKRTAGPGLFRSPALRRLVLAKNYLSSYYACLSRPSLFAEVNSFCLFVGHNKSGTSLIGSLLDAHPDVILADEVHALEYLSAGFSREQLFHTLLRGSREEASKGRVTARRLTPYSYRVPGQWQGRYRTLRVIGDGSSGSSTRRFAATPGLLHRLEKAMGAIDVKFIQVVRNPYDPISVMMVRGKRSFENAIEHYFAGCTTLLALRERVGSASLIAVRYEEFVGHPEPQLARLCRYLGVEPGEDYLRDCASILHQTLDRHREMVKWDSRWIDVVRTKMEPFDFLQGYCFDR